MKVSASASVAVLALAGCGGDPEPPAMVNQLVPHAAYNDTQVPVKIEGGPFRPAYTIDLGGGAGSIRQTAFVLTLLPWTAGQQAAAMQSVAWSSTTELAADVPADLPAGVYDVEMRDPRGNPATLTGGFESLGPDRDPPIINIQSPAPDAVVAADTDVPVTLQADDGQGHLAEVDWTVTWRDAPPMTGTCTFATDVPETPCNFSFTAPTLDLTVDSLNITAEATDTAGNRSTATTQIWVALQPVVSSFDPSAGPTTGMANIYVVGDNFVSISEGTQVLIGDVPVQPLTVDDAKHMHGPIPPHDPGIVPVVVKTGSASVTPGFFSYIAPPTVRQIFPTAGPARGGTPIEVAGAHFRPGATRVLFGDPPNTAELMCPTYVSEHLITGFTPPGVGLVTVMASDPIAGDGTEAEPFQYISSAAPAADAGADAADAGAMDANADAADAGAVAADAGEPAGPPPVCPPPPDGSASP